MFLKCLVLGSFVCGGVVAACSSSSVPVATVPPGSDAAAFLDANVQVDAGNADASVREDAALNVQIESEPNNGATVTEFNAMTLPGTMRGVIDPANDTDIFAVDLTPGQFWEWTAAPSSDLAPLVTLFDTNMNSLNPTSIGYAAAGAPASLQHFVLRPGKFVVAMRDARNRAPSQNKGGPGFGYALTAKRIASLPAIPVTFPSIKQGKLASVGAVDLYSFSGTMGKGFDIIVRALRKSPPSTLDSRLSLYDVTGNRAIITNDNVSTTITDSQVGGAAALTGDIIVIVDNEGVNTTDLSYEIEFKLR
jgi:hypothetical protein